MRNSAVRVARSRSVAVGGGSCSTIPDESLKKHRSFPSVDYRPDEFLFLIARRSRPLRESS